MLIERDYMKAPSQSTLKIVVLPPPPRTATQWANVLILTITIALLVFVISRIL